MTRKETEDMLNLYGSNLSIYREYYDKLTDSDFGTSCRNPFISKLLKEYCIENFDLMNAEIGLEHVFIVNADSIKYYTIFDYLDGKFGNTMVGAPAEYYYSKSTIIIGHYDSWFDKALGLPSIPPSAHGSLKPMMQQILTDMKLQSELSEEDARRFLVVALSKISKQPLLIAALNCPMLDDIFTMMEKDTSIAAIADNLWFKLAPGMYTKYGNIVVYGSNQYNLYDIFSPELWKGYADES